MFATMFVTYIIVASLITAVLVTVVIVKGSRTDSGAETEQQARDRNVANNPLPLSEQFMSLTRSQQMMIMNSTALPRMQQNADLNRLLRDATYIDNLKIADQAFDDILKDEPDGPAISKFELMGD